VIIRQLAEADVLPMLNAWNAMMVHDRLSEWELREAVFGTADHHPNAVIGAWEGTQVRGFIDAVVPEGEPKTGRVLAVCAADDELTAALLAEAETHLVGRGVQHVVAAEYPGCELAPGIDVRYEHVMGGFEKAGYSQTHTLDDMEIELTGYQPTPYQQDARRRAREHGVAVDDWEPSLTGPLRAFAERGVPHLPAVWFQDGWENGPNMMVATRDDEVIGYASYWPEPEHAFGRYGRQNFGAFGPIGVLREHRGHGVGTWLLSESQLRVERAGRAWLWAGWTNTPFYLPNGWQVTRQYAVWQKHLAGGPVAAG
jgi:GNAT superfamily N-acetyltransferase